MKISLLIPTRKRVNNLKRLIQSVYTTASDPSNIQLAFYVDDDDTETIEFFKDEQIHKRFTNIFNTVIVVQPRQETFGEINNILCRNTSHEILMLGADDIVFRTKNWDNLVISEFKKYPDGIALVFGYDGIQPPGTLATHSFISRKSTDILGYATPGDFGYNYADNWMTELYRQNDRLIYLPIYIEHAHWGVGKATYDETYKLGSDAPHSNSIAIWEDKTRLNADIQKLRANIIN